MQQENLTHIAGPEKMPSMPRPDFDHLIETNAESAVEKSAEKFEVRSEANAAVSDAIITTIAATTDEPLQASTVSVDGITTVSGIPSVAADEDLIEKEWVDKAKKIISDTKEDPYTRDEEVSKLQVEYIKKRYGRSVSLE